MLTSSVLVEVIIADTTSLRNRLFFSYIPAMPFLINAWVTGNISDAVLNATTWRWGIGMWAIIFPVTCVPLFGSLLNAEWRASKQGLLDEIPSPIRALLTPALWRDVFWQIDLVGLVVSNTSLQHSFLPNGPVAHLQALSWIIHHRPTPLHPRGRFIRNMENGQSPRSIDCWTRGHLSGVYHLGTQICQTPRCTFPAAPR